MRAQLIGILGGTFDPIHNGHLHIATSLLKQLPLDEVRFLPCFTPVHRAAPIASPQDRLAMLRLACANLPNITIDEHEIHRQGPSYMIDTLRELKKEQPNDHFCLILGQDSFNFFDLWFEWQSILDYCHLIIVNRPHSNNEFNKTLQQFIIEFRSLNSNSLSLLPNGKIFFCEISPLDISATQLRRQLNKKHYDEKAISPLVLQYIIQHRLYLNR